MATKFEDLKKKLVVLKSELKSAAVVAFQELSKDLFEANPTLSSFSWRQYTPYFDDGDTCHFSAQTSEPSLTIEGEEEEFDGYDMPEDQVGLQDEIVEFLGNFEDDDLLTMFGDHQKVTINRDGSVDSEDHDHE